MFRFKLNNKTRNSVVLVGVLVLVLCLVYCFSYRENKVTIVLYKDNKHVNFGDDVNEQFFNTISIFDIEYLFIENNTNNTNKEHYLCTGSIMRFSNNNSIIFGSGFISDKFELQGIPKKIISVRGPKTRELFLANGVNCPAIYGDPLILLPCLYNKKSIVTEKIVGLIPHYIDKENHNFNQLYNNLIQSGYQIVYIDIETKDYNKFLSDVNKCNYIISSSLHGIITGIVYKKKTIFLNFSDKVIGNSFKFYDFFESIGITYTPKNIYNSNILQNVIEVNYTNLIDTGLKLIEHCPFISIERKKELKITYNDFYKFRPL